MEIWIPHGAEQRVYTDDLPACCRRSSRSHANTTGLRNFECPSCGALWRLVDDDTIDAHYSCLERLKEDAS